MRTDGLVAAVWSTRRADVSDGRVGRVDTSGESGEGFGRGDRRALLNYDHQAGMYVACMLLRITVWLL